MTNPASPPTPPLSDKPFAEQMEEKAGAEAHFKSLSANSGEPSIEKLLDAYEKASYNMTSFTGAAEVADARAAVVGYVEELRKERDRLREYNIRFMGEIAEARHELSRLQANQLSPEEADDVLFAWDDGLFKGSLRGSAIAKLRSLSGNAP